MLAEVVITAWHWAIFVVAVLVFLALDLGVFHRKAHVVGFKEALTWTTIWVSVACLFGLVLAPKFIPGWGRTETVEFLFGYIVELSLSMDNVFVIALIFGYFSVPLGYQHRVLFWGILGALLMRGLMIWLGTELITHFHWMIYVMGAFLLFTGVKMVFASEEDPDPEKNPVLKWTRKLFPVSKNLDGSKFMTIENGKRALTPLALVLIMVETTDLIFAVDSIPAIFGITQNPYIVFTSNVFAILGLRSLYFVLAGAIGLFRYLKIGLALVLCLIGLKMVISKWYHMPHWLALSLVGLILGGSIFLSVLATHREKASGRTQRK